MYAAVHWTQKQIPNLINKHRGLEQEAGAVVGLQPIQLDLLKTDVSRRRLHAQQVAFTPKKQNTTFIRPENV